MNAQQIIDTAKKFRTARSSDDKAKIMATVPARNVKAFLEAIESLAQGKQGIEPYTNKKGEICGVTLHGKGTGKRGLYISNEALTNWNELSEEVNNYRLNPEHKF